MSRPWAEKGGCCERFWSITRRLYVQDPRPLGQSGTPSWLPPDRRRSIGLHRRRRSEEHTSETPVTNAHLVCRLLLETKQRNIEPPHQYNPTTSSAHDAST